MRPYYSFETELWSDIANVELTLNEFRPRPAAVVPRGGPEEPDSHRAVFPSVVATPDGLRMWYVGLAPEKKTGSTSFQALRHALLTAVSTDGIHWEKEAGSPLNGNCHDLLAAGVEYFPDLQQFIMTIAYHDHPTDDSQSIFGIMSSSDGHQWQWVEKSAIRNTHFEVNCSPKKIDGKYWIIGQGLSPYYHLYDGSECGRTAFGFYSENLKDWTFYPRELFTYRPETPFARRHPLNIFQLHLGFTIWPRERIHLGIVGHLWPGAFTANVRFTNGLLYSYDGLEWREPFPQTPILQDNPDCSWFTNVMQGNNLLHFGRETWYWFAGGSDDGNDWKATSEIGLATLRRDGFAWFSGRTAGPCLAVTQPISLRPEDRRIYLNFTAPRTAPLRATLCDARLEALAPPVEFSGDEVMREWNPGWSGPGPVRLKFEWNAAPETRLYGFHIGESVEVEQYLNTWRCDE